MSNVLITGESNFDEKNDKEVFNLFSTEQSCIHIEITCYKNGTLVHSNIVMFLLESNPHVTGSLLFQTKNQCWIVLGLFATKNATHSYMHTMYQQHVQLAVPLQGKKSSRRLFYFTI